MIDDDVRQRLEIRISLWSMVGSFAAAAVMTGSRIGLPASVASFTLRLKPAMLRTPSAAISW